MRNSLFLCSIMILLFHFGEPQQTVAPCPETSSDPKVTAAPYSVRDPYSLADVRSGLKYLGEGVSISWIDKRIGWLGDGVSIGVLKTIESNNLTEPKTVQAYLRLLRIAFARPNVIWLETNKDPKVTLFPLKYLRDNVRNPELVHEIEQTEAFVKSQTANTSSAPDENR